jgi:capsid protein
MPTKTQQRIKAAKERADLRAALNREAVERLRAKAIRTRGAAMAPTMTRLAIAGYDNAKRSRLRAGPSPTPGSSASQLDRWTREKLIRECRDLGRNNSIARAMTARQQDMIVGDGAIVTSTTNDEAWNEEADAMWNAWADCHNPAVYGHPDIRKRMSFWRICRAVVRAWLTDGDVLAIRTDTGSLSMVSAERIISPDAGYGASPTMRDGVELDQYGAPTRFHVAEYVGDGSQVSMNTRAFGAEDCMFLANPTHDDFDAVRGEPGLQAVIDRVEQLDRFIMNVGVAAEVATMFGLIFKTERPVDLQTALEAATPDQPSRSSSDHDSNELELQAGFGFHAKPGESIEQVKPEQPTTNFREYVLTCLMLIAAEMNQPLVLSHFDSTGLSWSNIKSLMAISHRGGVNLQDYLGHAFVRPVRAWKIREWMDAGELRAIDDYDKCEVKWPEPPVLDFTSEAKGLGEAVGMNLITHDQATRMLGTGRGKDVRRVRSEERKNEIELGIAPADLPGAKRPGREATENTGTPSDTLEEVPELDDAGNVIEKVGSPKPGEVDVGKTAFLVGDKTVGVTIASSTKAGTMTREAGIAILEKMVGLDRATAETIAVDPDPSEAPEPTTTEPTE